MLWFLSEKKLKTNCVVDVRGKSETVHVLRAKSNKKKYILALRSQKLFIICQKKNFLTGLYCILLYD